MNSTHRNHHYLCVVLFATALSASAEEPDAKAPSVCDQALDCAWGDGTFDDACAGFSAKMAAKAARYIAEHSQKNLALKQVDGRPSNRITHPCPDNQDRVGK